VAEIDFSGPSKYWAQNRLALVPVLCLLQCHFYSLHKWLEPRAEELGADPLQLCHRSLTDFAPQDGREAAAARGVKGV
jgi:hypothetical protein